MRALGFGICKSGRQLINFALQMANKHLALLGNISVETVPKPKLKFSCNPLVANGRTTLQNLKQKLGE
jgi:hypothetical protein